MERRKGFISVSMKFSLAALLIVTLCTLSVGVYSYYSHRADYVRLQGDIAMAVANAAAAGIDAEKFREIADTEEERAYYHEMKALLNNTRIKTGLIYLYTMVKTEDDAYYKYIAVGEAEELSSLGDLEDIGNYGSEPLDAYAKKRGFSSGVYKNGSFGYMVSAFVPLLDSEGEVAGLVCADIDAVSVMQNVEAFRWRLIMMAVVSAVVFTALAAVLGSRTLGKPIRMLVKSAGRIANGDLNSNNIKRNDEIGMLAANFNHTTSTLRRLIECIGDMSRAHMDGLTETYIDSALFTGAYSDVVKGANEMVREYVLNMREILANVKELGAGNFEVPLRKFPGNKASANSAVEKLRAIFTGLSGDISLLALSSANGDLSRVIDAGKYDGDWKVLAGDLNRLLVAIHEPINETAAALRQMAEGDFSIQVSGNYKGDFALIKDSFNLSQSEISSYIAEISEALTMMSQQNFRVSINRTYTGDFRRIKDAINAITDKLSYVLNDISESACQTATGSRQVSELSISLAGGAETQAGAIKELDVSMQRIASQTARNSDIVNEADGLIKRALKGTDESRNMMFKMTAAMDGINESSKDISGIINTIDDIAFQTNLLALNASIEASHAGINGAGFAVVAEEVRKLAAKSQESAQDTSELIESSIAKAAEGARLAELMAVSVGRLAEQIVEVSKIIGEVADASDVQNAGLRQINQEILRISEVTQSNTASSQESAAAAEELSDQAEILRNAVERFELKKKE